jgi:hypothetical protein
MRRPTSVSRRGRLLAFAVGLLLLGGLVAAVFTLRRPGGAVPGDAPVLGLAAVEDAFLVGTDDGLFATEDGTSWAVNPQLQGGRVLVASAGRLAATRSVEAGLSITRRTTDLDDVVEVSDPAPHGTAMALDGEGTVYVAISDSVEPLFSVDAEGEVRLVYRGEEGPRDILTLAVIDAPDRLRLLAGGLVAGLWELDTRLPGDDATGVPPRWQQLSEVGATAVAFDPSDHDRLFMGTPGGLLASTNSGRSWGFTEMRSPVLGMTVLQERFYVLTDDRLLFGSDDGESAWEPVG